MHSEVYTQIIVALFDIFTLNGVVFFLILCWRRMELNDVE